MSKIDALLRELCPEGVRFGPLAEVTKLDAGDRVTKANMTSSGRYDVYGGGTVPTGKLNEWNREHALIVSRAGSAGFVNFIPDRFWATDVCFVAEQQESGPLIKFVFYWMKSKEDELMRHTYGGSMPKIDKLYLWRHPVPLPPLEVQKEIVSVLDKFTQLEAELEAEKKKRRAQLDTLRRIAIADLEAESQKVRLGDFVSVKMCKRIYKSETRAIGEIPFYKIGTFGRDPDAFITRELFEKYRSKYPFPGKGEILMSCSGTLGRVVRFSGEDAYFQDSNIVWLSNDESKFLNRYLFHWLALQKWEAPGGTISRLYAKDIESLELGAPTLSAQMKLVLLLDKMEVLVNDINIGLPAEIASRRRQYEHYRNKLLTFKELDAA